jgi:hypothetical protein
MRSHQKTKLAARRVSRTATTPVRRRFSSKRALSALFAAAALTACGNVHVSFVFYSLSGNVNGLTPGLTLIISNSGLDSLTIQSSGNFTLQNVVVSGGSYDVTVTSQPAGESCSVTNGSGKAMADVTGIAITCAPLAADGSSRREAPDTGTFDIVSGAAAEDQPTARAEAVSWIDPRGGLWLFGGEAADASGNAVRLGDLWRFEPAAVRWLRIGGSFAASAAGVHGVRGVPDAANTPAARSAASAWVDRAGNLWLFGGFSSNAGSKPLARRDLWRFAPGTGLWTWISGCDVIDGAEAGSSCDTEGNDATAIGESPPPRARAAAWTDRAGDFWLFGGGYFDSSGEWRALDDLWRYSPDTGQWARINTSNAPEGAAASAVAGTQSRAMH